jgi:bifunctional oligoribonuclease and PAP phosphatase NrnA
MENYAVLKNLLAAPKNVAVLSHRNPDGDAIGSALAVRHWLEQDGHSVKVLFPSDFPENLSFLKGSEDVLIWDIEPPSCQIALKNCDIFFFVDFNALDRIDKMGEFTKTLPGHRVLIDHHLFPDPIADTVYSRPEASSTCELIYEFITMMGDAQKINTTVAECIYTGIVTDTGSFRHATNPRVFRIVAELLERGVDDNRLQNFIFLTQKEKYLRLLGHVLANRFEYLPESRTAILTLTKHDYDYYQIGRGDTEGLVNYPMMMREVALVAFIHEQPSIVKLSLRSKGDFDVQRICKALFNGGGHKNASGGSYHGTLRGAVLKFKEALPQYRDELLDV